jgi:stalled ribosome rescue protein Dom34
MPHYHAIVWLDHAEAKVFAFNADDVDVTVLHPHEHKAHIHHKANSIGSGKAATDPEYLHQIAQALNTAGEILIVGPGSTKLELIRHLQKHDPAVEKKVIGIETVDHPTDKQIVAHARKYFGAADRMRP